MPRGDKSTYTAKQKRQAEHIEEGYRESGTPEKEAEARAWATVNKTTGGGKKSGTDGSANKALAPAKKGTRTAAHVMLRINATRPEFIRWLHEK